MSKKVKGGAWISGGSLPFQQSGFEKSLFLLEVLLTSEALVVFGCARVPVCSVPKELSRP